MDSFEKQNAKNVLETLKAINRNINYLGRKLELTNDILKKNGVNVLPVIETTDKGPNYQQMVRLTDILTWKDNFYDNLSVDHNLSDYETKLISGWFNRMIRDLEEKGKVIGVDIKEDE
jgi:hypothetical protein